MERKISILSVLLLSVLSSGWACDVCGSGSNLSQSGLGLLNSYRFNFIGMTGQYIAFHSNTSAHEIDDAFYTAELTGRYHFSTRWKLLLFQPWRLNQRTSDGRRQSLSGLGDTRLLVLYTVLNNRPLFNSSKLFLETGLGLKAPLGAYDSDIHQRELPENFNLGNGSWACLFQTNLVWTLGGGKGFSASLAGQFNENAPDGYHFGNQVSSQLQFFWDKTLRNQMAIIPFGGIFHEYLWDDQYAHGREVPGTGGTGWFAQAGINLKKGNWFGGCTISMAMDQSYSEEQVSAGIRSSAQLIYIF